MKINITFVSKYLNLILYGNFAISSVGRGAKKKTG